MDLSHGADADRLDDIAAAVRGLSGQLGTIGDDADAMVRLLSSTWAGHDLEAFSSAWGEGRRSVSDAAERLHGLADGLLAQAAMQREASGSGDTRVPGIPRSVSDAHSGGAVPGPGSADNASLATRGGQASAGAPPAAMASAVPASNLDEGRGGGSASKPDVPPAADASPREVHDWWLGLSPDEQQQVLTKHPDWLGNRDGIPYDVRDKANRSMLDRKRAWLVKKRDEHVLPNGRRFGEYDEYQAKIDSIDEVKRVLDQEPKKDKHLIVLDTAHDRTQAAIARGDLDSADHIAVMTPGYTTTVDGSMTQMDRDSGRLKARTEGVLKANGDPGTVATVAWIGYQAPQHSTLLMGDSVVGSSAARRGGDNLAGFGDGIRAVRGEQPHVTAVGHSYGSTTTSHAVAKSDAFDDVVYVGSPGLKDGGIGQVGRGHAYVIEADKDVIADTSALGQDPTANENLVHLHSRARTVGGEHLAGSRGTASTTRTPR